MIAIASDHGGYDLKERVKKYLEVMRLELKLTGVLTHIVFWDVG